MAEVLDRIIIFSFACLIVSVSVNDWVSSLYDYYYGDW